LTLQTREKEVVTKSEITIAFQLNLAIEKVNLAVLLHYPGRLKSPLPLSPSPSRHKKKKGGD
jgi:hypothetical protein